MFLRLQPSPPTFTLSCGHSACFKTGGACELYTHLPNAATHCITKHSSNTNVIQTGKLIHGTSRAVTQSKQHRYTTTTRLPFLLKVKLSLCLTNQTLRHEGVWGSGCIDPHFLDLGTSWRWVVSFTPRPLYPRYPLDRMLGEPWSRSGRRGEEQILAPTGTRTLNPRSSSP
jgi:hypothetical protein